MKKSIIIVSLLVFGASFARSYHYEAISVDATILLNGDIRVVEEEIMNFSGEYSYVYRSFYLDEVVDVTDFSVKANGLPLSYEVEISDGSKKFTWRMPMKDEVINFTLTYTLVEPFTVLKNEDYLLMTLVFKDRSVPVSQSINYITFPKAININELAYDYGVFRRYNPISAGQSLTQIDADTIMISAFNLPDYGYIDFDVHLPKGVIEPKSSFKYFTTYYAPELIVLLFFLSVALTAYLVLFDVLKKYEEFKLHGKDPVLDKSVYVKDLNPAIAGLIVDEHVSHKEVLATIVDLAIRDYIYFREVEEGFFKRKTIYFMKTRSSKRLNDYEALVMEKLFSKGDRVKLSDLRYSLGYSFFSEFKKLVHDEAVNQGLFEENVLKVRSRKTASFSLMPILCLVFNGLISAWFIPSLLSYAPGLSLLWFVTLFNLAASFILLFVNIWIGYSMPKKTALGVAAKFKYDQLKDFIKAHPLKEGRIFDEFLPEAIALGVQKDWVKKAEEIGYQPEWYHGRFNTASFALLYTGFVSSGPGGRGGGVGGVGGGGGAGGGGGGAG